VLGVPRDGGLRGRLGLGVLLAGGILGLDLPRGLDGAAGN